MGENAGRGSGVFPRRSNCAYATHGRMRKLTVGKKIILSFAVLIVMFLGFGIYANHSGSKLNQSTADLMDWTKGLSMASRLSDAVSETRINALRKVMETDPEDQARVSAQLDASKKKVEDTFAAYKKTLDATEYDSDEERAKDQEVFDKEYAAWQECLRLGEDSSLQRESEPKDWLSLIPTGRPATRISKNSWLLMRIAA